MVDIRKKVLKLAFDYLNFDYLMLLKNKLMQSLVEEYSDNPYFISDIIFKNRVNRIKESIKDITNYLKTI